MVQITRGNISDSTAERMNGIKQLALANGATYETVEQSNGGHEIHERHKTLLSIMCDDADVFYVDRDMEMFAWPTFDAKNQKPYFAKHESGCGDEMLLYGNKNTTFFKSLFEEKSSRKSTDDLWWFRKILRVRFVNFFDSKIFDRKHVTDRDAAILGGNYSIYLGEK